MDFCTKVVRRSTAIRRCLLLLCLLFLPLAEAQQSRTLLVVASKASATYEAVIEQGLQSLDDSAAIEAKIFYLDAEKYSDEFVRNQLNQADLVVTVGTGAADRIYAQHPSAPMVSMLITESAFFSLSTEHYGSIEQALSAGVSVVYIDQPLTRQIRLGQLLLPQAKTIGFMVGPASLGSEQKLSREAFAAGMQGQWVAIDESDNPITTLEPLIDSSDLFIPLPDSRKINLSTAKWILQLGYRHRTPIIAFSAAYVNSGALAAVYSSADNVAEELEKMLGDWQAGQQLTTEARYPSSFSIQINRAVAGALHIELESPNYYRERMP